MELTISNHNSHTIIIPGRPETFTLERDHRLSGEPIRVSDAAILYDIPQQTLSRWAARGMIRVIKRENHVLELDAGDVQLAVKLYVLLLEHTTPQRAGRVMRHVLA